MTLPWPRVPERFRRALETHQWVEIPLKEGMDSKFWDEVKLWQCPRCKVAVLSRTGYAHYLAMLFKWAGRDADPEKPEWDSECMCEICYPESRTGPFIEAFQQTCADRAMKFVLR